MEVPIFKTYKQLKRFEKSLQDRIPEPPKTNKTCFEDKDTTSKGKIEVERLEENFILEFGKNCPIFLGVMGSIYGWDRHLGNNGFLKSFKFRIICEYDYATFLTQQSKQDKEQRLDTIFIYGDVHAVYREIQKTYKNVYFAKDGVVSIGADAKEFTDDINNTLPEVWSIVNSARTHSKFYKQKCKELKLRRSYDKRGFYRFEIKKCANRFFSSLTNDNYEIIVETYQGLSPMVLIIGVRKDIYNRNKENNNVKTKEIGKTDRHRTTNAG